MSDSTYLAINSGLELWVEKLNEFLSKLGAGVWKTGGGGADLGGLPSREKLIDPENELLNIYLEGRQI